MDIYRKVSLMLGIKIKRSFVRPCHAVPGEVATHGNGQWRLADANSPLSCRAVAPPGAASKITTDCKYFNYYVKQRILK